MPKNVSHYLESWEEMDDGQGRKIGQWCRKDDGDPEAGYCKICKKKVNCGNQGLPQLKQHAKGTGHQSRAKEGLASNQTTFFNLSSGGPIATSTGSDRIAEAEILWVLKTVASNFSYASNDNICKLFARMFPDSKIASDMSLGSSKLSYLISDGFGPLLCKELVEDLTKSMTGWTLCYDESPTAQHVNQLDLHIRYFSVATQQVVCRFYKSIMLGRKPAKVVAESILRSLKEDNVPMNLWIALMGDGPNVNKATHREIDNQLKAMDFPGLIPIDSCVLHHVHNGFRKGIDVYGSDVEELAIDIFYFFKSGGKREDFKKIQLEMNLDELQFLRHVSSRWVTLVPTVQRLLSQIEGLRKLIKDLSKDKLVSKTARYGRISRRMEKIDFIFQMHFLISAGEVFTDFLTILQCEKPMIHVLHNEMCAFIRKLARRFVKSEYVASFTDNKLHTMDLSNTANLIKHTEIDVGEQAKKELKKIPSDSTRTYTLKVQDFFKTMTMYLLKTLPLDNDFIRRAAVLNLGKEVQLTSSTKAIVALARGLPHVVQESDLSRVADEWHLLHATEVHHAQKTSDQRIDHVWRDVLAARSSVDGEIKFPVLARVVKSALAVSHGNADVERGFSCNKKVVTNERTSLSPESINGNRLIKDKLKFAGVPLHEVEVTTSMKKARKDAYKNYELRLVEVATQASKRKAEEDAEVLRREQEEAARKQHETNIKQLEIREKDLLDEIAVANTLIVRGNDELKEAIRKKDFSKESITFSQTMVESGQKKMSEAQSALEAVRKSIDSERSKKARLPRHKVAS